MTHAFDTRRLMAALVIPAIALSALAACSSPEPTADAGANLDPSPPAAVDTIQAMPTVAAIATDASQTGVTASGPATVDMATHESMGDYLVDSKGMSLYLFVKDTDGTSQCMGDCAQNWIAVLSEGDPMAGDGVDAALLGTTARDDGSMQVTYNNHPLYTFVEDMAPGDTNGQEKGDAWYLVTPAGEELEASVVP